MGEVGQNIILFIGEGGVEGFWPEGNIDEGMAGFIGVIVQVVDPGAFHGLHVGDEIVDGCGVIAIFQDTVLHAMFTEGEFVNIGKGIGVKLQRYVVEGAIGEFYGKMPGLVSLLVDLRHAVQRVVVPVIILGDVQAGAGGSGGQDSEEKNTVYRWKLYHGLSG